MHARYTLTSFDPENAYTIRDVILTRKIHCGDRDDYFFAKVVPPLEGKYFGEHDDIDYVILAPRHKNIEIEDAKEWPIHVYVCVMKSKKMMQLSEVTPESLKIINWGLLAKEIDANRQAGET